MAFYVPNDLPWDDIDALRDWFAAHDKRPSDMTTQPLGPDSRHSPARR